MRWARGRETGLRWNDCCGNARFRGRRPTRRLGNSLTIAVTGRILGVARAVVLVRVISVA
jgi:hypothetical protein